MTFGFFVICGQRNCFNRLSIKVRIFRVKGKWNMKKMKKLLALLLVAVLAFSALAGCGSADETTSPSAEGTQSETPSQNAGGTEASDEPTEPVAAELDKAAYDALIASGSVADDAAIAASAWASAVKEAGVLRVGGTRTSFLFSQLNETDNSLRGFDAGLYQLLTRYILGDESKYDLTQVDSSTRESVLTGGTVDVVFATYSITPARQEVISFAGPYYTSQQAVLVKAGNTEITGIDSLAGKTVATQAGSTGPDILAEYAPDAIVQEFQDDTTARQALEQGRVDAYVTDYTLLLNAMVKNPGLYEIAGGVFGPVDPYGIGLPLDSDGVAFVNDFLQKLIDDGTWAQLWQITLGDRTGISTAPEAPAIG